MSQIKTVFIDCDGVLYDKALLTYEEMMTACQQAGVDLGIDWADVQKVREALRAQGWRGWYNVALEVCRHADVGFHQLAKKMVEYVDYTRLPFDPELLTLLQQVASQKDLFILTNNTRPHLEKIFQHLFHKNIFQTGLKVFTVEDTLWGKYFYVKAHPEAFTKWCQKLHLKPQETLMIDDTEDVVKSAQNQGLQTAFIPQSEDTKKVLKGLL